MSETLSYRSIGVYGGTFDPIHNAHLEVARAVAANFELDRLLIIPAHRPPHKNLASISDAYHRYAMAALATIDERRLFVSTIELEMPDKPYTFETVERIKRLYGPETKQYLIIGADSFAEINTWREPERLLSSVNLIVAARPGSGMTASHLPAGFGSRVRDLREGGEKPADLESQDEEGSFIYLTDYVKSDISSTEIRRRAREGRPVGEMVPPHVADYIEKYRLYR
ncbi:MAG TPA: nicotinate-nucleotide adenylyltransferase [Blastocatellia bacterium]|nr:nicotinate-nucleotide adenylyltransferase [Blastocatellia bacterium]